MSCLISSAPDLSSIMAESICIVILPRLARY